MNISKHFDSFEFRCRCGKCGFAEGFTPVKELLSILEGVREYFNSPVKVTSCVRCVGHNKAVGGVDGSQHTLGMAADIQVFEISPSDVYDYINSTYGDEVSIGKYKTFCHIDIRKPGGFRW